MTAVNQIDATRALSFGRSALESANYIEAHAYFTHVLETEPLNAQALMGKGLAAGWQSNLRISRLAEMLAMYCRVRDVVPAGSSLPAEMASDMLEMLMAYERLSREHTMEFISVDHARYEAFDRAEEIVMVLDVLREHHTALAQEIINPMMIKILRAQIGTSGCMGDQRDRFTTLLAKITMATPAEVKKVEDAKSDSATTYGVIAMWILGLLVFYVIVQPNSIGSWILVLAAASFGIPILIMVGALLFGSMQMKLREKASKRVAEKSPGQL